MTDSYDYTTEGEQLFDQLTDRMSPVEARRIVEAQGGLIRINTVGGGAIASAAHPERKSPRYSRRGGRSYPEASDSELDPHWNVPTNVPHTAEHLANASQEASKEELIIASLRKQGFSEVHIAAKLRNRRDGHR